MLAKINSAVLQGIEGQPIRVEVHVSNGLPGFTVVGLPDAACRESRDRVRAALLSSGFSWPLKRVTVNLAPSGIKKAGAGLDLPIAVGLLAAVGQFDGSALNECAFIGELGLDGGVRAVPGALSLVGCLRARAVIVPTESGPEAALARRLIRPVSSLSELADALAGRCEWRSVGRCGVVPEPEVPDLSDVRGQRAGRYALEVAAAGGHNLLFVGPPGAGKTMLAERLIGLLPPLSKPESLETTRVYSAAAVPIPGGGLVRRPPFRAPHQTASLVSIVGGGTHRLRPGEISLAHNGVLFLDEMAEFSTAILDALRQPLEQGSVMVTRASAVARFPARFLLVGAMNPCPCGRGLDTKACRCTSASRSRYLRRVSGPLLDRFDLRVVLDRPDIDELVSGPPGESTAETAARVHKARQLSAGREVACNALIPAGWLDQLAPMTPDAQRLLTRQLEAGTLNARGLHRVRRVARTIADVAGCPEVITVGHMAAALQLHPDLFRPDKEVEA
ncbi:MAG TPA: YifB family Mg chelatase-like AAA ATPase [Acidimicrobiales bacterium]|nr:YifB family Mg chelatase-like AAA ATPase [Acidimicrobiales bacterium]